MIAGLLAGSGLEVPAGVEIEVVGGDPVLPTSFRVGEAAVAALAAVAATTSSLHAEVAGEVQPLRLEVDHAAMSLVGFAVQRLDGAPTPRSNATNATVGLYRCGDGRWIHLQGGFPGLRAGTLDLLGCDQAADADEVGAAVLGWEALALEDALAVRALCGAVVRRADEWRAHPHGSGLAARPAVEVQRTGEADGRGRRGRERPLEGLRVLDLTRLLAGAAVGRVLAEHGADVLRIGSERAPDLEEFFIDTGHGKRSARLDFTDPGDLGQARVLAASADVVVQSYRPGALGRYGLGPAEVIADNPGVVYVSVSCYGAGPWGGRPGWEQMAQSACGIAAEQGTLDAPALLPAAACDYLTGYLAAAGAVKAVAAQRAEGGSWRVDASLARTAMWVLGLPRCDSAGTSAIDVRRWCETTETGWGSLRHLRPVVQMPRTPPRYERPPSPLGTHPPSW